MASGPIETQTGNNHVEDEAQLLTNSTIIITNEPHIAIYSFPEMATDTPCGKVNNPHRWIRRALVIASSIACCPCRIRKSQKCVGQRTTQTLVSDDSNLQSLRHPRSGTDTSEDELAQ